MMRLSAGEAPSLALPHLNVAVFLRKVSGTYRVRHQALNYSSLLVVAFNSYKPLCAATIPNVQLRKLRHVELVQGYSTGQNSNCRAQDSSTPCGWLLESQGTGSDGPRQDCVPGRDPSHPPPGIGALGRLEPKQEQQWGAQASDFHPRDTAVTGMPQELTVPSSASPGSWYQHLSLRTSSRLPVLCPTLGDGSLCLWPRLHPMVIFQAMEEGRSFY